MKMLTDLLIKELPIKVLLESLHNYVGEKQAEMIKEIVEVNQLPEEEVRELVKVYLYE
jgi:hypothetical protein